MSHCSMPTSLQTIDGFQMFPVFELLDLRLSCSSDGTSSHDNHDPALLSPTSHKTDGRPLLLASTEGGGGDHQQLGVSSGGGGGYGSASQELFFSPSSPPSEHGMASAAAAREWLLLPPGHYGRKRPWLYLGTRAGTVLLASLIAFLLPEFELIVAFSGSLGASLLAFVVPGLLALRVYPSASSRERAAYVALIVFGVLGGGIGAAYALKAIVQGDSQC